MLGISDYENAVTSQHARERFPSFCLPNSRATLIAPATRDQVGIPYTRDTLFQL
jgi:hypothetical protein